MDPSGVLPRSRYDSRATTRCEVVHTMTSFSADARVDAYIAGLADWQQVICRDVRALVHAADPDVVETIKRTRQPYFVLQGNICALLAAKYHVNVFLYDGAIVPDPEGIITAGHHNQTARTVAIRRGGGRHPPAPVALFKAIIPHKPARGWGEPQNARCQAPPAS